ncbi:MAG TPA: phosphopyruvate hydratase [Flavobacterium sp.]|nr:phosphopyruvate hydratase [Flavobacterium sp.]
MSKKNTIKKIQARQILDSRGNPTLEVEAWSTSGISAVAGVPSGASTGKAEAHELRDGGEAYFGKAVGHAVENVNTEINAALRGFDIFNQSKIDQTLIDLDGKENKSRLGANAILGASLACARLASQSRGLPLYSYIHKLARIKNSSPKLPKLMFNLINGGLHADSGLDIQEYLFIPSGDNLSLSVRQAAETYHRLAELLHSKGLSNGVGDEGGFAPHLKHNTEAFDFIIEAAKAQNYTLAKDFNLGLDAAANSFTQGSEPFRYNLKLDNKIVSAEELIDIYNQWIEEYGLVSIEDGLSEDDKLGWKLMTERLHHKTHVVGQNVELIGDDLFVTQARRLIDGAHDKLGTAIIIKPNQVGTLSETINTVRQAKSLGYACIASHRSGETNDDFIADLAVGLACDYIKAGAPARGERVSKYNRLLKIEALLAEGK